MYNGACWPAGCRPAWRQCLFTLACLRRRIGASTGPGGIGRFDALQHLAGASRAVFASDVFARAVDVLDQCQQAAPALGELPLQGLDPVDLAPQGLQCISSRGHWPVPGGRERISSSEKPAPRAQDDLQPRQAFLRVLTVAIGVAQRWPEQAGGPRSGMREAAIPLSPASSPIFIVRSAA